MKVIIFILKDIMSTSDPIKLLSMAVNICRRSQSFLFANPKRVSQLQSIIFQVKDFFESMNKKTNKLYFIRQHFKPATGIVFLLSIVSCLSECLG